MPVNETIERIVYEGVDKITAVSKSAENSVKQLRQSLDAVKNVMGVLGVTVGAGVMVQLTLDTIRATAALDDMAEATGATVEGLSAIQRVAKVAGADFEGLTSQIGKMIKGLREGGDEGSRTAKALDFLGVKAKDADGRFRDTSQVLIEVAQRLAKYEDGGNKVALIQDILGKGAERYIPLLKDMAEGADLHATVTAKQAAEAEKLEKSINRLSLGFKDAWRSLVSLLTPALVDFTEKMAAAEKLGDPLGFGVVPTLPTASQADVRRVENALAPARKLGYQSPDQGAMAKAQKDREFVARQLQEGLEEEQRIQAEAFHWTAFYSDKKLEAARATEQARIQAIMDSYDREQELAIEQGAILSSGPAYSMRIEALRQQYLLEGEIATEEHEKRLEQLAEFSDAELEAFGGKYALIEGLNAQHQARMLSIEQGKHQATRAMEATTLSLAAGLLQNFAGKSKGAAVAVIAISKGLHIAQTIQATGAAVMRAYADLGPIAGSAAAAWIKTLGAIQVGLIGATGLVEAGNIGGGAAAAPTFPVNSITGLPSASPAPSVSGTQVTVTLVIQGNLIGNEEFVRNTLIPALRDEIDQRDVTIIGPNSRQAAELAT